MSVAVAVDIGDLAGEVYSWRTLKTSLMHALFTQRLRFIQPGGSAYPEWEETTLGQIITIKSGKSHSHLGEGNIPVIGTGAGIMFYRDGFIFDGESVVLGRKGSIDKPRFVSGKFWVVDTAFYTEMKNVDVKFFYQLCLTVDWQKYSQSTSLPSLTSTGIAKIPVSLPSLAEQQRIAEVLSAVDAKIAILDAQIVLWRAYKQGLMQTLFTQRLRFTQPNGSTYPAWEETTLGDVAKVIMGQSPPSSAYNDTKNGLPLIQGNADRNGRHSRPRSYTRVITKTCYTGDILMSVRAPAGTIFWSDGKACMGRGVCSLRSKDENRTLTGYLFQYLVYYETGWSNITQGSTFLALSGDQIKTLTLSLPSLPEQQRIAELLSSVDTKIAILDSLTGR